MNVRRVATGVGVAAAVGGLALVVAPDVAARLGVARMFVAVFGFVAALLAVADVRALTTADVDQATPPDVESVVEHPRPGEEIDDVLAAAARGYDRYTQEHRDRLEARVHEVAVDVLTRQEDCTEEAAESMLVDGSWTDDPYAKAFLGAHEIDDLPLRERIRNAFRPEATFARRARHAIDALAEREGHPVGGPDGADGDDGDRPTGDRDRPAHEAPATGAPDGTDDPGGPGDSPGPDDPHGPDGRDGRDGATADAGEVTA